MLILAPRHPERVERVDQLVRAAGHSVRRLSDDAARDPAIDVLLVDTVGELAGLYQLACVAFVGGSLVPVGGHNVLEPAVVGVPVLFGPHTENARETARALENVGAAERVPDADGLTRALSVLLGDGSLRRAMGTAGRDFVRSNRGALDRTVDLLLDALTASRSQPSGSA
jgi:3-deoxy-D-manno-octulosonic-acid transferase